MGVRLIFLSWAYPPMEYPRAIQVERLARHCAIGPIEIVCAATRTPRTAGDVTIREIPEPARMRLYRRLNLAHVHAALVAPDPQRAWAADAARAIAERPLARDDVLVTFGQPMSDHCAGLALTRRFGNRWIAHFSDPWADNPFARAPLFRRRNLRLERAVIERADRVLLTSQETADLVMAKYPPAWRAKASVLPHAFDASLYPVREPGRGPLVMRYLGSLYGARSPLPLLRALEAMARRMPDLGARLTVEFIGTAAQRHKTEAAQMRLPEGLVRFLPTVDYRASLALMRAADLLLHIDAPAAESVFLASKLIDYIGARRPIFAVTPAGTAARLVAEIGGWIADPTAPDAIAARLAEAIAAVAAGRDADWGDETVRRRYDIGGVARAFDAIVGQVCGQSGAPPVRAASKQEA
jgi:hypothetical protein